MDTRKTVFQTLALLATFSSGFSAPLNAGDLNYSYIEGRFLLDAELDADNFSENADGDGIRFGGSFRLSNEFYAFGSYEDDDLEFRNIDIDFSLLKFGAGYILPINSTWDSNFSFAYGKYEADTRVGDTDENGFELSAGARGMVKPEIELRGALHYTDYEDSDTYFTLGGDYFFAPNVSAGLEIDLGGDYESMSIGAKYYFK